MHARHVDEQRGFVAWMLARENARLPRANARGWRGRWKKNAAHLGESTAVKFRRIEAPRDPFKVRAMGDVPDGSPAGQLAQSAQGPP